MLREGYSLSKKTILGKPGYISRQQEIIEKYLNFIYIYLALPQFSTLKLKRPAVFHNLPLSNSLLILKYSITSKILMFNERMNFKK